LTSRRAAFAGRAAAAAVSRASSAGFGRAAAVGLCRAASAACLGVALAGAAVAGVPGFEQVRSAHRSSDTVLLDRHGEPVQALRTDFRARRGEWVPLAQFSPALRHLLIQGEDQRFWSHGGVDWAAVMRSAMSNARGAGSVQGASTLTMQLAALIDADLARPAGGRSIGQKLSQAAMAARIEAGWSKPQILEAYLNLVPLRGELVGMPAAAGALFGKHPSGLDQAESALLVALLRAPAAAPPRVVERGCALLSLPPGCERVAALAARALPRAGTGAAAGVESLAPHFARWVMRPSAEAAAGVPADAGATGETGAGATGPAASARPAAEVPGRPLRTTLDARLQRVARQALRTQLAELQGRHLEDGAVLVLDNASGEVLAWVGSSGPGLSEAPEVDAVLARRQPGSTLKPFVYQLAFEQGLITPASLLHDAPADLDGGSGAFMPRNYDHRYRGWVSARTALASSLNVPTARTATLLGPQALFDRLQAFGLGLDRDAGHHGLALALGSADVTLLRLTNAYRTLANGGLYSPVRAWPMSTAGRDVPGAARPRRVAQAESVFQVTDILADADARAATFGLDSALVTRGFAAVKTGTSKDMRDNWCIGFSDRYTVGVWVGNASGAPMHRVSGTQGAAPVWRTLMQHLHAGRVSRPPPPPAGLVQVRVAFDGAQEPARPEWLAWSAAAAGRPIVAGGTAATSALVRVRAGEQVEAQRPTGIASPRDGSIFAIDPDMPRDVQRIAFVGEPGQWWLDGRRIGQGPRVAWSPWPGAHRLELRAASGHVLGRVAFEVRGAGVARPR